LQEEIASAKARFAKDQEAIRQNQELGWTLRKVVVNNYTDQYLDVYVNGNYKAQITPGMLLDGVVPEKVQRRRRYHRPVTAK
jgi:hypothetical protein